MILKFSKLFQKILKQVTNQSKELETTHTPDSNNNLLSKDISANAILGHYIEIQNNTIIDAHSIIGSYTYIGKNTTITKAIIGRYCSIGDNVTIGPGEHNLGDISTSMHFCSAPYEMLTKKDCIIENDVWIGVDSIIKRGVKVSNGAVIGANSIVTSDVPPFAVVVGNPAKIIKFRFNPKTIQILLDSSWWEFDLMKATELQKDLTEKINEIKST